MTKSTLSTKTVRCGMQVVALLAVVCGAARAGEWPVPFPLCPSAPLTYIPLWNIPSNTGFLCFVGNPPTAPGTTIFDVAVVPVIVKLLDVNGNVKFVLNPTKPLYVPVNSNTTFTALNAVDNSPIFSSQKFILGSTTLGTVQWGEMAERASFWKYPGTHFKSWHVEMATFPITPSETLDVPNGSWYGLSEPNTYGVDATVLDPFLLKIAKKYPKGVPILLTYNIGEDTTKLPARKPGARNITGCCAFGYHDLYTQGGFTSFFIWGSYLDAPGFGAPDLTALSHEVAEFMHDPTGNNLVQSWPVPGSFPLPWSPPYKFTKCQGNLEVGDPLEDRSGGEVQYDIKTSVMDYHFQNVVTASWLMQASPSFSVNGWYTLKGTVDGEFAAPAPVCPTP